MPKTGASYASNLQTLIMKHVPAPWLFRRTHHPVSFDVGRAKLTNVSLGYPGQLHPIDNLDRFVLDLRELFTAVKTTLFHRFAFLDFEDCSLHPDSWPIEVGLNGSDDVWSDDSARLHNIPRRDLDTAPDIRVVVEGPFKALNGTIALSDAPEFELHRLYRLLAAAGATTQVQVEDFEAATSGAFSPKTLEYLWRRLERIKAPHRAGIDSVRLAKRWIAGLPRETGQ